MTQQENLLTNSGNDLPPTEPKEYLKELVGEDKKFKDLESLAKGKYESDQYIDILTRRLDEMRNDYLDLRKESDQRSRLEELLDKLNNQRVSNETPPVNDVETPAYDPKMIKDLVANEYQSIRRQDTEQANWNLVKNKLEQRYGDKFTDVVRKQINELGITESELNNLARTQPKLLMKSLGLDQEQRQETFTAPPRTEQRRDNFAPTSAPKRTWSYYQDLKRKDPRAWQDRKTAIQMQQDAIDLGEEFRDGDYYVSGLHER